VLTSQLPVVMKNLYINYTHNYPCNAQNILNKVTRNMLCTTTFYAKQRMFNLEFLHESSILQWKR